MLQRSAATAIVTSRLAVLRRLTWAWAVDMRGASQKSYDDAELRKRIAAQLDTCMEAGVRHVVLSAFGCGAFQNPSPIVAGVYKQEVLKRKEHFDVVAFAIFLAGYGPDNFGVFRDIFEGA